MSVFEIGAFLIGLSALFGYINYRYLRAPQTIGLVLIALAASLALLLIESAFPSADVDTLITGVLERIDFHDTLMHGMLSFLLFAGALHVDFSMLRSRYRTIGLMATLGTILSTALIAGGTWILAGLAGYPIPFIWALVFGALISPTDPVAVLGIFESVRVPPTLKATLAGESLFNDGVGVVVFTVILGVALQGSDPGLASIGELFVVEVLGGFVLGLVAGYVGYRALYRVNEPSLEVLITLAVVMVAYATAIRLGVSGPIAMVVAGLFIGNEGMKYAVSESSADYLKEFWSLLDNILNSVLFLLIGLEVLIIARTGSASWVGFIVIPVTVASRWLSVALSKLLLSRWEVFGKGAITILTWGGLRGGIAVALALSLPANEYRPFILSITYVVVLFSIIVQGLTVTRVVQRVIPTDTD